MKNKWISGGLLAPLALPAYAEEKEEERVENVNAGQHTAERAG